MTIKTKEFSNSASAYVHQAFGVWIGRYWWAVGLPIAAAVCAGLYNPVFYLVALMMLMIVYPGILMLLYYNWALRPDVAFSLMPHKVEISEAGFTITYSEREDHPTPSPRIIPSTEIATVQDTGKSLVVTLKSSPYDMIEIPISAFEQPKDANAAISLLKIED